MDRVVRQARERPRLVPENRMSLRAFLRPNLSAEAYFVKIYPISHKQIWTGMSLHARGQREAASPVLTSVLASVARGST